MSVLTSIRDWLKSEGVSFREVHHGPTYTSQESAQARGEDMRIGGKSLLMKGDGSYALYVLPADRRVDSNAIRTERHFRKLRFATREELHELTGLVPGCVPPFGRPILPFDLHVDTQITMNDRIAFNAGSLTDSIVMQVADYLALAKPLSIFRFSVPS